ncbi:uncharacterized protein LOC106459290 isoform X2 [Limulus polyphemus]|uniref:Uncharacterized protein LOC106459290 isoform X2 n=1 Tax=Limulus polyphemus TaxID=6850 RepID=A0ABM1B3Z9_LIMPO|nr:uncharacterized protein LOC106459290 isoform X2 [Limulus polyphemus]
MAFLVVLGLLSIMVICSGAASRLHDECSTDHLETCKATVLQYRDVNEATLSQLDIMKLCKKLRNNMNCIFNYSKICLEPNQRHQLSDLIIQTRNDIHYICEGEDSVDEYWAGGGCYGRKNIKKCSEDFAKKSVDKKSNSEANCGHYLAYENCVKNIVLHCKPKAHLYLSSYLIDDAQKLSWTCSDMYHKTKDLPKTESLSDQRDVEEVSHVIKGVQCISKLKGEYDICREEFNKKISNDETYSSTIKIQNCCAFIEYDECVSTLAKNRCDKTGQSIAKSIIVQAKLLTGDSCNKYEDKKVCSALTRVNISDQGRNPSEASGSSKSAYCLVKMQGDIKICREAFEKAIENKKEGKGEETPAPPSTKEHCCAFHKFVNCVHSSANYRCDKLGEQHAEAFIENIKITTQGFCDGYGEGHFCSASDKDSVPVLLLILSVLWLISPWKQIF